MKRRILNTAGTVAIALMATTGLVWADQARPRNPGAASGGSSSGGSSGGGGNTGSVAVPRGGGTATWGGGRTTSSRPSQPVASGTRRTPSSGGGSETGVPPTAYARPRSGAPVTGQAVARGTVGTLPPIVSGPIYWGPGNNWHFFPWGFGGMGLGYLWDPWFWGGFNGYWGGGGYPWGPMGMGGLGPGGMGMGMGGWGAGGGGGGYSSSASGVQATDAIGNLRLRIRPRQADVFVGGHYAGIVDDFDGPFQSLKLPQGPHTVEIRADGYEPLELDVLIVEGETTTYRGNLDRDK